MRNVDQRTVSTGLDLKEAFLVLLEEKSYESITINDITKLANYNRTTFYNHFYDKEQLLDEIIDEKLELLISSVDTLIRKEIQQINYVQPDMFVTQFSSFFSKHISFTCVNGNCFISLTSY